MASTLFSTSTEPRFSNTNAMGGCHAGICRCCKKKDQDPHNAVDSERVQESHLGVSNESSTTGCFKGCWSPCCMCSKCRRTSDNTVYYTLKNELYFKLLYTFTSPRVPQASPGTGSSLKGAGGSDAEAPSSAKNC